MVDIKEIVSFVMSFLKLELQKKLQDQGHGKKGSSKLIDSIDYEVKVLANFIVANMELEDYYIFVEKGVRASRIPYQRGSGKKTSKYIDALVKFFQRKVRLKLKDAKNAAFATANKHKKEGMPSRSSFRFSNDGTRLKFVETTLNKFEEQALEILEKEIGDGYEIAFTNMLNSFEQDLAA